MTIVSWEPQPLAPHRLAAIWHMLPDHERLPFVLALDETLADRVIELTHRTIHAPVEPAEQRKEQDYDRNENTRTS